MNSRSSWINKNNMLLAMILILAAVLRFYGLTNQSLWLDELHTMNGCAPGGFSWGQMFSWLLRSEPHPPLFYILERLMFSTFGHTDLVARSLTATVGIASVWAMYYFGRELWDRKLGLIAALLTSVNYYNIDYSQEARCYIFVFLFTAISFAYFIRLIKNRRMKDMYGYAITGLLLLYTHYFSLLIIGAQGVVAIIQWITENDKEIKKTYFKVFGVAAVIMLLGYLPWATAFYTTFEIKAFWIGDINQDFAIQFFQEYFGSSVMLMPLICLLLLFFFFKAMHQEDLSWGKLRESPLQLICLTLSIAIVTTYFIPYLRSKWAIPMMVTRYTIALLPLFLIVLAYSLALISARITQTVLIVTFVFVSLVDIVVTKKYYYLETKRKTEFREMTAFINKDPEQRYPIVEGYVSWQHSYYLNLVKYDQPVLAGSRDATIDSILNRKSLKYDLAGFWVAGAHGEQPLSPEALEKISKRYTLVEFGRFFDAWAYFFIRNINDYTDYFPPKINLYNRLCIPVWSVVQSAPIPLKPGDYVLKLVLIGTPAKKEYPHINIELNGKKIGDLTATESFKKFEFPFTQVDESLIIKLDFDNDYFVNPQEDRNVFISAILIMKK